jgi:hypothetical protein
MHPCNFLKPSYFKSITVNWACNHYATPNRSETDRIDPLQRRVAPVVHYGR